MPDMPPQQYFRTPEEERIQGYLDAQTQRLINNASKYGLKRFEDMTDDEVESMKTNPLVLEMEINELQLPFNLEAVMQKKRNFGASITKIGLEEFIALNVPKYEKPIPFTPNMAAECYGRSPQYFADNFPALSKLVVANVTDEESELLRKIGRTEQENIKVQEIQKRILSLLTSALGADPINITPQQLIEQTLKLSSNAATRESRRILVEIFGDDATLNAALEKAFPGYTGTISLANFGHWIQPDPNMCHYEVFAAELDSLVRRYVAGEMKDKENEIAMMEAMKNNPEEGFLIDITTKLRRLGYLGELVDCYEKTGSYGSVFWITEEAEKNGMPPFSMMGTVFTLVRKRDGAIKTFSAHEFLGLPVPPMTMPPLKFLHPNDEEPRYFSAVRALQVQEFAVFQNNLWEAVREFVLG